MPKRTGEMWKSSRKIKIRIGSTISFPIYFQVNNWIPVGAVIAFAGEINFSPHDARPILGHGGEINIDNNARFFYLNGYWFRLIDASTCEAEAEADPQFKIFVCSLTGSIVLFVPSRD